MSDSYGGTFLISIMMVFVVFIVAFTAVIVSFAKTFRVKNQLINFVEQYQYDGTGLSDKDDGLGQEIDGYLSNVGYNRTLGKDGRCSSGLWYDGFCIESVETGTNKYYKITVYVTVSVPFFVESFTLPVSGETKSYHNLTKKGE